MAYQIHLLSECGHIISYVSLSLWLLQEKDKLDVVEVNALVIIPERLGKCCED